MGMPKEIKFREEAIVKISNGLKKAYKEGRRYSIYKGKHLSEEHRKRISQSLMGHASWNKGKIPWNKGRKMTLKEIENNRISHIGIRWNEKDKLKHSHKIKEVWKKFKGTQAEKDRNKKISQKLLGIKRNPTRQQILNSLKRNSKSQLEIKFESIVNQLGLPYKFVGNGEVIVARKVPDFVDSNGKKVAIEVYYRRHKNEFRGGVDHWKAERAKVFNENGWEIIYFDETQVNENTVKNVLGGG